VLTSPEGRPNVSADGEPANPQADRGWREPCHQQEDEQDTAPHYDGQTEYGDDRQADGQNPSQGPNQRGP
jgi:hypothetical protein